MMLQLHGDRKAKIRLLYPDKSYVLSMIKREAEFDNFLNQLKAHSPSYYVHNVDVGLLAHDMGKELGLSPHDLDVLVKGALMHDIGKLQIPRAILHSPEKLEGQALEMMRQHTKLGFNMLRHESYAESRLIVVAHHEYQEKSYPRNDLAKHTRDISYPHVMRTALPEKIANLTQIVVVCDILDALSADRSYKPGMDASAIRRALPLEFTGPRKEYAELILKRLM